MNFAPITEQLIASTIELFTQKFRREPEWVGLAPGRVNMIGGHTDYNDGFVVPFAVERYTVVVAAKSEDPNLTTAYSESQPEPVQVDLHGELQPGEPKWGNYIKGVAHGLKTAGFELPNVDMFIQSNLPGGAGLSSSAALEVGVTSMFEQAAGKTVTQLDKALLCQKAEHDFVGVPCGAMDQMISVFGKPGNMLRLDCKDFAMEQVKFDADKVGVLITNSNVKHELGNSQYGVRRSQCESAAKKMGVSSLRHATMAMLEQHKSELEPKEYDRARHVIGEIERTLKFLDCMSKDDFQAAGQLLYQTHASLRDDYEVSCPELDALVEIAQKIGLDGGMYGSRMTGGGFGGCTVSLVAVDKIDEVAERLTQEYAESAAGRSASILKTRPAQGAMAFPASQFRKSL